LSFLTELAAPRSLEKQARNQAYDETLMKKLFAMFSVGVLALVVSGSVGCGGNGMLRSNPGSHVNISRKRLANRERELTRPIAAVTAFFE